MGLTNDGYWSPREILGYKDNRQDYNFFMILSDRGRGKSFGLKMWLLNRWEEHQESWMCLFRTGVDMAQAVGSWIDPYIEHKGMAPDRFEWEGDVKGGIVQLKLDGEIVGYFRTIAGVNAIKHEYFPDRLTNFWWDEFIPLNKRKLGGVDSEGDALRTILKTVNHDSVIPRKDRGLKPLVCFLVANPFTWDNEVLAYFHVDPRVGYGVHRIGPGVVCERLEPVEERKEGFQTVDDFLGTGIHRAEGWQDQMGFVREIPKGVKPWMSLRFGREFFGLWTDNAGTIYVEQRKKHLDVFSYGLDGNLYRIRFGTHDGLQEDESCLEDGRWGKRLKGWMYGGMMFYESPNTKFNIINCILNLKS